jgi:putative hemolysin
MVAQYRKAVERPFLIRIKNSGQGGDISLRDVNRELGIELPESDEWSTLGGLCLSLAGRVPEKGDLLTSPDGTALEIEVATDRRIERVRLRPLPKHDAAPPPP